MQPIRKFRQKPLKVGFDGSIAPDPVGQLNRLKAFDGHCVGRSGDWRFSEKPRQGRAQT